MSSTPSSDPDPGSWIGQAAQFHGLTDRRKCSSPVTTTGRSSARAVPGALVPATRSSQFEPSTKPMVSALRKVAGGPLTQSSCPASSLSASNASQARAACPSTSSSNG